MKVLWLDSNAIIRYLTDSPQDQAAKVQQLFMRAEKNEVQVSVDRLIVAEVIWTLQSSVYGLSMANIAEDLISFLSSEFMEVEDRLILIRAIELSRDKNVDFIDAYLAVKAADRGDEVSTFDRTDFKKLPVTWRIPG